MKKLYARFNDGIVGTIRTNRNYRYAYKDNNDAVRWSSNYRSAFNAARSRRVANIEIVQTMVATGRKQVWWSDGEVSVRNRKHDYRFATRCEYQCGDRLVSVEFWSIKQDRVKLYIKKLLRNVPDLVYEIQVVHEELTVDR